MESIINEFNNLKTNDLLYSPIVGDVYFQYISSTYNNDATITVAAKSNISKNRIFMLTFDRYGRYIIYDDIIGGERLLFKNKNDFLNYKFN